jgi:hypothetical protein
MGVDLSAENMELRVMSLRIPAVTPEAVAFDRTVSRMIVRILREWCASNGCLQKPVPKRRAK